MDFEVRTSGSQFALVATYPNCSVTISATCCDAVEKIGTVVFIEVTEVPFAADEEALPENRVAFRVHDCENGHSRWRKERPSANKFRGTYLSPGRVEQDRHRSEILRLLQQVVRHGRLVALSRRVRGRRVIRDRDRGGLDGRIARDVGDPRDRGRGIVEVCARLVELQHDALYTAVR